MVKRIIRKFRMDEISAVDVPAQEGATVRIMKSKSPPPSSTPMTDRLAALADNYRRIYPHLAPEEHYARAFLDLKPLERDQVRAEETGEFQRQQAEEAAEEEARLRQSANIKRASGAQKEDFDMGKIDTGGLAKVVLDSATEAMRKANPKLSREQAFARVYTDPKFAIAARAEHDAYLGRIGAVAATPAANDPMVALKAKAAELRKVRPELSEQQAFSKVYQDLANADLVKVERAANLGRIGSTTVAAPEARILDKVSSARVHQSGPLAELQKRAAELRKTNPELSQSQAFAKVYADPANRDLAAAERRENRPEAS